jgi:glycosyltransferase involved in cell wall biosynthesis
MLLLRALMEFSEHLPKGFPGVKAVFVGDGPARQELQTICKDKGIDATFTGMLAGETLAECYASGDVFCFPSFTEVRFCRMRVAARILTLFVNLHLDIRTGRSRSSLFWIGETL